MRLVLKMFKFLVAILLLAILGFGGWLTFSPPNGLLSASAYAAKMVCSNVFIAKRDAAAVIGTDVEFALPRIVNRMKISVDSAKQRVEAAYLGLFAKRYPQYEEGRGCTLVSKDEIPDRAAPLLPGEGFNLPADTFLLQGHLRQVIAIIPSRKLVILRMGLTREEIGYSVAKLLYAIVAACRSNE